MNNFEYKIEGTKEILEALDVLNQKETTNLIKSVNRKALNINVIKPLKSALPYSAATKKAIRILSDRGEYKDTGLWAGATTDSFWLRFLEKGTKLRTSDTGANRGKITPRPIITRTIDSNTDGIIDFFNKDFGDTLADIMQKKLKRITK